MMITKRIGVAPEIWKHAPDLRLFPSSVKRSGACTMKKCCTCKQIKDESDFHKDKTRKDGFRSDCKSCTSESNKRHYNKNKDRIREKQKKYKEANKDQVSESRRKYYETHKDHEAEYSRKYYLDHKDQMNDRSRKYYENNREQLLERDRQRYQDDREKYSQKNKKYRAQNQSKIRAHIAVRDAVLLGKLAPIKQCTCSECGKPAENYHHNSYHPDKWLEVTPLCVGCHRRWHAQNEPEEFTNEQIDKYMKDLSESETKEA